MDAHTLPAGALRELCQGILERGVACRFVATGGSMSPFIRDGDLLTVGPLSGKLPRLGEVVAFVHPGTGTLTVHRVVRKRDGARLMQGDALAEPDGWVEPPDILGRVVSVERNGRRVRLGMGAERAGIALLRRYSILWNLARAVKRLLRLPWPGR